MSIIHKGNKIAGNAVTGDTLPIGSIIAYPGNTAPNGWLLMGQDYSRTAYPELFAVIGTKFGTGDGSTTFGTNTKGRVFVGLDTSQTEFNVIGKIGGHKLLQAHSHDMGDVLYGGYTNYMGVRGDGGGSSHAVPNYSQTTSNSVYKPLNTGGGDSQNLQPYIVTNYIIKAFNVAPTASTSTVVDNLITPSPTDSLSAYQGKILNEKIDGTVLWTNPNNGTTAFPAQTVTVTDMTPYSRYKVWFRNYTNYTFSICGEALVGWSGYGSQIDEAGNRNERHFSYMSATSIAFSGGSSNGSVDNNRLVPIKIVGYK